MSTVIDKFILEVDHALRAVFSQTNATRPLPVFESIEDLSEHTALSDTEQRHAAGLMRVNHVGEVCAQALYRAQALATSNPDLVEKFQAAADEEGDHLAWTAQRLKDLDSHPSLLNPIWYAGAFSLGLIAGKAGDPTSLGFVVETERQVEQHLDSHLKRLPENDLASRAIVEQMREDEVRHGQAAQAAGAHSLPLPVRAAMRAAAKLMTVTAYRI